MNRYTFCRESSIKNYFFITSERRWSKLLPLRADPFSEGIWCAGKQTGSRKVVFFIQMKEQVYKAIHLLDFTQFFKKETISVTACISAHISPSIKGSALKRNFSQGSKFLHFTVEHFPEGRKIFLIKLLPVSVPIALNPYLAFRDNSRAGGVCQLKSPSYLQYTTCNHSEQVFSYRIEPTFIQTRHFSLDSQVLDFTHTKNDREYQISSCH